MDRKNKWLIGMKSFILAITAGLFVFATVPMVQNANTEIVSEKTETSSETEEATVESSESSESGETRVEQPRAEADSLPTQLSYVARVETTEAETQEASDTETEPQESADTETEPESKEPEYTVEDAEAVKYANQASNVRSGPSTDYEQIGSLALNQEVQVTGQASTGWYRIAYNGGEGFVSNALLVDAPIVIEQPQQPEPQPEQPPQEQPQQPQPAPKQLWEYSEDELVAHIVNSIITPEMDAFARARAVNDYLCRTMTYDDSHSHYSTFDALAYGTGVCQGYANAFWRLMNAAGVETDYVRGYGWSGSEWGRHGWNRCLINGTYYYTDVTWNDSMGTSQYLLISFEQMEKDHREQSINPSRVK